MVRRRIVGRVTIRARASIAITFGHSCRANAWLRRVSQYLSAALFRRRSTAMQEVLE